MKKLMNIMLLSFSFLDSAFPKPDKKILTIDWIHSDKAQSMAAVPKTIWLKNNKFILYDTRIEKEERNFKLFDPEDPGNFEKLLDLDLALLSINELINDSLKFIDWPISFDDFGKQAIYNHKGDLFLLDIETSTFLRITNSNQEEKSPRFSPDGKKIAFVRGNDLFIYDMLKNKEYRLTNDGSDTLLNGTLSWVYWEEIFGRQDLGFWWSKDSKYIVFLQTDESMVTKMHYVDFRPQEANLISQRYPKTGTKNPQVKVGVIRVDRPRTRWINLEPYEYICRIKWLPDGKNFSIQTMNRAQDTLNLYLVDRKKGEVLDKILTETDPGWVNINDDLYFLNENQFLWQSERDGYAHIYRFKINGELINQVTKGQWSLRSSGGPFWLRQSVVSVDEKHKQVYFTSLKKSATERHLYRINFDGKELKMISKEEGVHSITFSPNGKYYIDKYSNISQMPNLKLYSKEGFEIKTIAQSRTELINMLDLQVPELITIPTKDGFYMPAQILKPREFNSKNPYPVIYHVYGGPSAPTVFNSWQGNSLLFDNLLLKKGYLIVKFDHRSATAISKKLENRVNLMMSGPIEMEDIVDGIKWLKSQSYVDEKRVGIWGWSGGGSFTLNAMTNTTEFKAGIAGAPVTDWHYYDTKWGEFAMKKPQDNPEGYDKTSFVKSAKNLHGRLLLMHGTYDDNVHPQNSWHFIDELIKHNKMFDMMFYPMRKHGFSDKAARIHRHSKMVEFWLDHL